MTVTSRPAPSAVMGSTPAMEAPSAAAQSRWLMQLPALARRDMMVALAAPVAAGLLLVPQAAMLARALDLAIVHGEGLHRIAPWVAAIAVVLMARAGLSQWADQAAGQAAEVVKDHLRRQLFAGVLGRGPQWTRARVSGELAAALLDHVEALHGFVARYLPSAAVAAIVPIALGLAVMPADAVAALILLVTAPLIPVFMALTGWGAEAASRRHQAALRRLSGLFADRVRGLLTLRVLGRAKAEAHTVRQAGQALNVKTMAVLRIAFLSSAVLELFAALGVAGVAVYIGLSYLGYFGPDQAAMSLRTGLFCLLLAPEVYNPLRQFAANYHDRAAARAAAHELERAMGELPRTGPAPEVPALARQAHRAAARPTRGMQPIVLELASVSVRANRDAPVAVRDATACLHAGEHIALTGPSGSGKTSMLEAICGWRDVAGGTIWFLGAPATAGHTLDRLDGVTLVGQKPFFAPVTVAQNLRLAAPDADDASLWNALMKACADTFVRDLPQSLDTVLGVAGHGLSGGQLQRLALARLYLTDPALILLDEPTAHLDAATRDAVLESLLAFAAGRAMVLATHDPAVAARLGSCWALHNGALDAS